MRLLRRDDNGSLHFVNANERLFNIPYAILSHTWGKKEDEVLHRHVINGSARKQAGFSKVQFALDQAEKDGLRHVWIDTCCIDKESAVELDEAINSMYVWYERSAVCYAYLSDISNNDHAAFDKSLWFTRGWTLQELVAPRQVIFHDQSGTEIGERADLATKINALTGIRENVLRGKSPFSVPIAERFQWSSRRKTSREQDKFYCLIGLLDVHMGIAYGKRQYEVHDCLMEAIAREHGQSTINEIRQAMGQLPMLRIAESSSTNKDALVRKLQDAGAVSRHIHETSQADTCTWILRHPSYKRWVESEIYRSDEGTDFLWIQGHPGAGKSTLMRFLDSRTEQESEIEIKVISFYFPAKQSGSKSSVVGMYASLLLQLLELSPQSALQTKVRCEGDRANGVVIDQRLDMLYLKQTFSNVLIKCDLHVRCFIDGLDECEVEEIQDITEFFNDLMRPSSPTGRQLNVCVASRYYPVFSIKNSMQIRLEEQAGHHQALHQYLNAKLDVECLSEANSVRERLLAKANGTFMWLVPVVDSLNSHIRNGTLHDISRSIDEIPTGLLNLYRRILERQDYRNGIALSLSTKLLLCARRPLTSEEIYYAIHVGMRNTSSTTFPIGDDNIQAKREVLQRFVANSTRGFAEQCISDAGSPQSCGTVRFVHVSIRDFCLDHHGLKDHFFGSSVDAWAASHARIRDLCYNYLKLNNSDIMESLAACLKMDYAERALQWNHAVTACTRRFPMLDYAAKNLMHHAEHATPKTRDDFVRTLHEDLSSNRLDCLMRFCDETEKNMWFKRPDMIFSGVKAVHLFAANGCHELVESAARLDLDLEASFGNLALSPLLVAMQHSSWVVVHQLIIYGVSIDKFMDGFDVVNGLLLLQRLGSVSTNRHVIRLPRNRRNHRHDGPAHNQELKISVPSDSLGNILRMFFSYGASVNLKTYTGCTPLLLSLSWQHYENGQAMLDNIRWLLEHGASATSCEWNGRSALDIACANKMAPAEVFKLLLDSDAAVVGHDGQHSIITACAYVNLTAVDVLVKNLKPSNLSQLDSAKALLSLVRAAQVDAGCDGQDCKHREIILLLLARGVDTTFFVVPGRSPYEVAAQGHNACSQMIATTLAPFFLVTQQQ